MLLERQHETSHRFDHGRRPAGLRHPWAWAAASTENDALAAASAKVSLTQAISVAEQHAAGKATKAEFERGKPGPLYEVEVVSGSKVFDVKVDAEQGTVLASREDKLD